MKLKLALFALCVAALAALPASAGAIGAAPTVTVSAPANNGFYSAPPALTFTTTGTAVTKTCTLSGPGVDEYEEPCTSPYKPLATLAEGAYTYSVSVSNTDGSAAASRSFKIDRTNPSIAITAGPAEGAWTNAAGASVTATVTDANPAYFNCRIDDGSWNDCVDGSPSGGTNSAPSLSEGSHRFWFFATDKAGNTWSIFRQINFDRTAPYASISITTPSTNTNDNTPAFLLGYGDNYGTTPTRKCRLVGETEPVDCNGSTWLIGDGVTDGQHTAEFTVADNAGNQAVATQTFTVDSTLPAVTYGGFPNDKTTSTLPDMEFWVDDPHEGTARCAYDAADWSALSDCNEGSGHVPAAPLSLGAHSFWIEAVDTFGNSSSAIYNFEVVAPAPDNSGGGQAGGNGNGGAGPAVTLKTTSSKVKKGKFTLTVAVATTNQSACRAAVITIAPKVKRAKALVLRRTTKAKNGVCVATAKVKLAAKFKKKKAAITAAHDGVSKKITIKL